MSSANTDASAVDFVVQREDLHQCKFVPAAGLDAETLQPGQVLLRVAKFAFTANNVTYAVVGDLMPYWNFFPAEEGWGRVPVWGFGDVLRSRHDGVAEGERVFGYFPMSTHLVVQPEDVSPAGFVDASPHRSALPAVYNRYSRAAGDPVYEARYEDQQMLLWPLFMTSFLLDDFIADNDFFGADAVVLSSASSKTAFGLAFLLQRNRTGECVVVGLTSPRNAGFVESLGCYDEVATYDRMSSLPPKRSVVFVDMAGNGEVVRSLHHHFGDRMKHSCVVGMTHWERRKDNQDLPGPTPTLFFAPSQIEKRIEDWGPGGLQQRFAEAWRAFLEFTADRIEIVAGHGRAAVAKVYLEALRGDAKPTRGHVLSLYERD
jgi:hypothetical protein